MDIASRMDMMMSMLVDLSNKVNGQEEVFQAQSEACHISSATSRHEPKKARWQNPH